MRFTSKPEKMTKSFLYFVFVLAPFSLAAQNNVSPMSTYVTPYGGVLLQNSAEVSQFGTAHKRGNYNAFDTDFDLQVNVKGESKRSLGSTYGLTYGSVWNDEGRKWNPGFEVDLFYTHASHESSLANEDAEEVTNVSGPNGDSVLVFVEEHYAAGHHTFSNSMTQASWNAALNLTLTYNLSSSISVVGACGVGFTAITLAEAESLQSSPAPTDPGFETTTDNGGDVVNHFNSVPQAADNSLFGQLRLGANVQLAQNLALRFDARALFVGTSEFNFGSTRYTDHAPTDNWMYTIDRGVAQSIAVGLCYTLL